MKPLSRSQLLRRWVAAVLSLGIAAVMVIVGAIGWTLPAAAAAQPAVPLGTAYSFAVLAGTTVTNTGPSVITGNLGLHPGSAVTGFPPGKVINGKQYIADAFALQAKSDLKNAYTNAAGRTPFTALTNPDLSGKTLSPGVYKETSGLGLTGKVILDAHGDANAVFIFQAGSTLITGSGSTVSLTGGAQACNVFWQVSSSASLGSNSTFVGTILALTSAALTTGATVAGRVLVRNGEVSLESNDITVPKCSSTGTTTTTTTTSATSTTIAGSTTTTTAPGVPVPVVPTGEPWAGWPYWALTGLAGFLGLVCLERAVRVGRRQA